MRRRNLLKRTGAAVSIGLFGGCVSSSGGSPGAPGGGDGNDTDGGEQTTTTTTTTPEPTLKEKSFKLKSADCGTETNEASVSVDEGASEVVVKGTITGGDSCAKARLASAKFDPESGFSVTVETFTPEDAGVCSQCLTEIQYEATFAFKNSVPESVTVTHEAMGKTTTAASTGSGDSEGTTTTTTSG